MQIINLEATISTPTLQAEINTPSLQVEMRTLRLGGGGGGTTDYNDLTNKPKIEGVTLQGNVPISDLGLRTSDLINDSGFITTGDIPTKTSDLTNDSNFQDATQVANAITAAIPTNVSSFTNDVGYITNADIPTNVSSFTNDAGYLTSGDLPSFAVDSVNGQTGTVTLTGDDIEASPLFSLNDTIGDVLANHGLQIHYLGQQIPTKVSDLTNDSGFITAAGAPVQSVNGQTGTVILKATDLAGGQAGYADISNAGSQVFIQDAADNTAVAYMTIEMSPIQSAGTPTPSDPLPITGLTDVVIMSEDGENPPTTTTIPLGQTVYGGYLNVTTGVLTIEKAIIDLGDITYTYDSAYTRMYGLLPNAKALLARTMSMSCSCFLVIDDGRSIGDVPNNACYNGNAGGSTYVYIKEDATTDPEAFKTNVTGQKLVYDLATPITVNITPAEIKTYATQCVITVTDCNIKNMRYFTEGSEFLVPQVKTILEAFNLL